jgi:DNA-binding MarR family transcriptional regulator
MLFQKQVWHGNNIPSDLLLLLLPAVAILSTFLPHPPSPLLKGFSITPQSMNEQVSVLGRKKLLKKEVDPSHKRILHLRLTPKGKKLLVDCNAALDTLEENLLKILSENETQT